MKILITGAYGLVGHAAMDYVSNCTDHTVIPLRGKKQTDLRDRHAVNDVFNRYRPDYVIHAAANVGGVGGNACSHGSYLYDNVLMNSNVIDACRIHDVKKVLAFSSVCVFPDGIGTLNEENMHNGPPCTFNFAYAHAKRLIDIQIEAYKKQYGIKNYCSIIPCNIFGKNDWYNIDRGHVIPSLMHKLYNAIRDHEPLVLWGDGSALREFIYADDLARIIIKLLDLDEIPQRLIVADNSKQYTIKEIAETLVRVSGYDKLIKFDTSKPNGQHSRPTDTTLLKTLLPDMNFTELELALYTSWLWFKLTYPHIRQ